MFKLHDVVRLREPDKEFSIPTHWDGVIVDIMRDGYYCVEFFDDNNETVMDALLLRTYTDADLVPA